MGGREALGLELGYTGLGLDTAAALQLARERERLRLLRGAGLGAGLGLDTLLAGYEGNNPYILRQLLG